MSDEAEEARRRLNLWLRYGNPRPNPISDEGKQFENDLQLVTELAASPPPSEADAALVKEARDALELARSGRDHLMRFPENTAAGVRLSDGFIAIDQAITRLAARLTAAPPAPAGLAGREEIARVIDPHYWGIKDRGGDLLPAMPGDTDHTPRALRPSLAKADAILALRSPPPEVGGKCEHHLIDYGFGRSKCQRCGAEFGPPSPSSVEAGGKELRENLARVTEHLTIWAYNHPDDATTETWSALHCARLALAGASQPRSDNHG